MLNKSQLDKLIQAFIKKYKLNFVIIILLENGVYLVSLNELVHP